MKIAKPQDWKIEPLPDIYVTVDLNLSYSKSEKKKIIMGLIPKVMEEKWFVFFDQEVLNFHRSWKGHCIYRVYCCDDGDKFVLTHADVNRNPEQYKETIDEFDQQMIPYLIDILLLKKQAKFPWSDGTEEDSVKIWSSMGNAIFSMKSDNICTEFIRIIHTHRFLGFPAPAHRPYAFYADAESLRGRTIADCYSLVKGMGLPLMESENKHSSPYIWNQSDYKKGNCETPISSIKIKKKNEIMFEDLPLKMLEKEKFVVLRVSRYDAVSDLDVFPATWSALSFIISDSKRMGARQPGWNMDLKEYATARIHALFKEIQANNEQGLLALTASKESLGLTDLDRLPEEDEEREYYSYLSRDSAFTNKIVDLFGINSRCWHGCGYIGSSGEPICRFFLLHNKMVPSIKVSVMRGKDVLNI